MLPVLAGISGYWLQSSKAWFEPDLNRPLQIGNLPFDLETTEVCPSDSKKGDVLFSFNLFRLAFRFDLEVKHLPAGFRAFGVPPSASQ